MISHEERRHLLVIKSWSAEVREATQKLLAGPLGALRKKLASADDPTVVFDNIDWLIALIEREDHTAGVKAFVKAVEAPRCEAVAPPNELCPVESRCNGLQGHKGPHFAWTGEHSCRQWDDVTYRMNFEGKK